VRVFTEEVRLPVAATDTYGHYDPSLEIDDVLVLEDGQPQQIRSIQHLPANVLLVLDTGNDLGLKDTKLTRDVALRIIAGLNPGDRIAIMQFATKPELLQNWTSDRAALAKVLKTKLNSGKNSRLSTAIAAASEQFRETPPGTRHIVLVTDGVDTPGVFNPQTNNWFLTNGVNGQNVNNSFPPAAFQFFLGQVGDLPVAGDWNGDGFDTVGVFRTGNSTWFLSNGFLGVIDFKPFIFGSLGSLPIAGDWNGDGIDSPGEFTPKVGLMSLNNVIGAGNGIGDIVFNFGQSGDLPVAGDWDGKPSVP